MNKTFSKRRLSVYRTTCGFQLNGFNTTIIFSIQMNCQVILYSLSNQKWYSTQMRNHTRCKIGDRIVDFGSLPNSFSVVRRRCRSGEDWRDLAEWQRVLSFPIFPFLFQTFLFWLFLSSFILSLFFFLLLPFLFLFLSFSNGPTDETRRRAHSNDGHGRLTFPPLVLSSVLFFSSFLLFFSYNIRGH